MAAAADRKHKPAPAREADRLDDVGYSRAPYDQSRAPIDIGVPDNASGIVAPIAWLQEFPL